MEMRFLTHSDYDILSDWWKSWRWTPPAREFLPENGTGGVMIFDKDTLLCAGFLYKTNSKVAWIEFIVSNPECKDKSIRHDALIMLIVVLTNISKTLGFEYCYSIAMNEPLINKFKEVGFTSGATNFTELIKKI